MTSVASEQVGRHPQPRWPVDLAEFDGAPHLPERKRRNRTGGKLIAYIRAHSTRRKRNGKQVKTYAVVFREPVTDSTGLPTRALRSRQESYATREQAQERCDELNNAKHSIGGPTALADQRRLAAMPYGHYAAGWLAEQRRRVAEGTLKQGTYDNYQRTLGYYVLPVFGGRPIGAITLTDCEQFRADLAGRLARRTVNNVWQPFAAVFRYAMRANAVPASPADAIDRSTATNAHNPDADTCHHPLSGPQVAALPAAVGERAHPVYELLVLFLCYTGLRRAEAQGLELRDVTPTTAPDGTVKGSVRVQRTTTRRKANGLPARRSQKQAAAPRPYRPGLSRN